MPELPEVETVRRGLLPYLKNRSIGSVLIRQRKLRWPIPPRLTSILPGQQIKDITRRGKYLLMECSAGTLIFHLGMSGRLRFYSEMTPHEKHDHFELGLAQGGLMRLNDPRRFGAVLWTTDDPLTHPLLMEIGPEPLSEDFSATKLHQTLRKRTTSIKQLLMDGKIVAGVGNIYANEALFRTGIRPQTPGRRISLAQCTHLVAAIRETLTQALAAGGSSLRDFVDSNGEPGYFQQQYFVYGRTGEPCRICQAPIKTLRHGQRASFYCPNCQKS
jgi:formamidopyrimidine-DNA glycosylase